MRYTATSAPQIGTLREGALHADLRAWYQQPGDELEVPVDGYVIDLVRGDHLIEFQTGSFSPLRKKLPVLLAQHKVRLVTPVAVQRHLVRLGEDGEILSRRRSPKRGRLEDVFAQLVSIPALLNDPGFSVEVVLTEQEEVRVHRPGKAFRRHGWVVQGRSLRNVIAAHTIADGADAAALLPESLPAEFSTADVADAAGMPRRLAQQMMYCLTALGETERAGKRGQGLLYRRVC